MSLLSAAGSGLGTSYFSQNNNTNNNNSTNAANATMGQQWENSTQSTTTSPTSAPHKKEKIDYVAQFKNYIKKTPAQRLREDILKKLGLSEEDLKKMAPEKRPAIEQKISQEITRALQGDGSDFAKKSDLQKFSILGKQHLSSNLNSMLLTLQELGSEPGQSSLNTTTPILPHS